MFTRIRPLIERCPRNHPESRMQSGFRYEFFIRRTWPRHRNEISALKATLVEKFRIPLVILPSPPLPSPLPPSVQVASIVNFKKISNLLHWERAESIAKIKRNNFYRSYLFESIAFSLGKIYLSLTKGNFVIS